MSDRSFLDPLHRQLQAALQVEHATIPPYFTAWASIQDGANGEAAEIIRSVMLEEMLHLTLVANMLNAVGGSPSLTHKHFVPHYPHQLPHTKRPLMVSIEKFSPDAINTFLSIERPEAPGAGPQAPPFDTLGQFYDHLEGLLRTLCDEHGETAVFCGKAEQQVPPSAYYGAGRLIVVTKLQDALGALTEIVEQGEGHDGPFDADAAICGTGGREPAHFYRFLEIRYQRRFRDGDADQPSGAALPVDYTAVHPIRSNTQFDDYPPDSPVLHALEEFAATYGDLLEWLEQAFNGQPDRIAQAVHTMFALKNQAQALMRIPSELDPARTVGLTFDQSRRRSVHRRSPARHHPEVGWIRTHSSIASSEPT